ncbi:DNA-binding protein YbiB [Pigmentiphaga soli]|uniref:DNA-binding protein YbiB n=1 Tax=Pigmentiphaga soli TaxID=1007095 RepID=A0ABP8GHB0_9BURK
MNEPGFACAPLLREIGRGKDGSRALSREQAQALMAAILDGRVSDLELGGVLLALRMKGEAAAEVAGFLDAAEPRGARLEIGAPVVVLPTYNGARRLPNLVPLLAWALTRAGVPVLMHGQASDPAHGTAAARVGTEEILRALGVEPAAGPDDAAARLRAGGMAYLPLDVVHPGLARLVGIRRVLGVRNVAHTLVKLLCPVAGPSLLMSSYTHPEFGAMLGELFAMRPQAALLMRATEGEAVANVRRPQRVARWLDGAESVAIEGAAGSPPQLPELPEREAAATAAWIESIRRGETPMPQAIADQCRVAIEAVDALRKAGA